MSRSDCLHGYPCVSVQVCVFLFLFLLARIPAPPFGRMPASLYREVTPQAGGVGVPRFIVFLYLDYRSADPWGPFHFTFFPGTSACDHRNQPSLVQDLYGEIDTDRGSG